MISAGIATRNNQEVYMSTFLGLIFIVIAYLLGSLSSAIIVCRIMGYEDPRTQGSRNPGATNVLRIAGKKAAMITLLGDALKGFIPVVLARMLGVDGFILGLVALAAFIGHLFPVFFDFKGGKGVATAFGAILGLNFFVGIIVLAAWVIIAAIFKFASLASLAATALAVVLFLFAGLNYFIPVAIMAGLLIWRHWDNIERLRAGTESTMEL